MQAILYNGHETIVVVVFTCLVCYGVQNLEKNYRDYQFRVTHLDPVIDPQAHQREQAGVTGRMQKDTTSSHGKACIVHSDFCCEFLYQLLLYY